MPPLAWRPIWRPVTTEIFSTRIFKNAHAKGYDVTATTPGSDGATGRTGSSDTRAPVGSVSRTRKDFSWWQCFDAFESDGYAGDRLRSHAANVCLDGSDAVVRHP